MPVTVSIAYDPPREQLQQREEEDDIDCQVAVAYSKQKVDQLERHATTRVEATPAAAVTTWLLVLSGSYGLIEAEKGELWWNMGLDIRHIIWWLKLGSSL